jgi:choline dehydrogenase-like flavoprotein
VTAAADTYDVIVVGTGAGGGTLARHLAPSGKRILLIERGDWLPRELENWQAADVFVDDRYISPDTWYDAKDGAFQPQVHYYVGGATKLYGACGVLLDEANMPYSTCVRCANCDGFPCPLHAKADAEVMGVRPALTHPNVTLRTNATAVRLATDPAGTAVTEVVVEHDGERERYAADVVVVSCGAANTARLLLASDTDKHPHGLANGSDQVWACTPATSSRTTPTSRPPSPSPPSPTRRGPAGSGPTRPPRCSTSTAGPTSSTTSTSSTPASSRASAR